MSLGLFPVGDISANYDDNPMVRRHSRGPEGKRCRTCIHVVPSRYGTHRTYWKCARRDFSHGQGADHRLKRNACRLYEEEAT